MRMLIPEAQKHTDPADPDLDANPGPEHCFFIFVIGVYYLWQELHRKIGQQKLEKQSDVL